MSKLALVVGILLAVSTVGSATAADSIETNDYNLGVSDLAANRVDRAVADFDAALRISPNDISARLDRAYARLLRGDLDGSIADYTWVIQLDPGHVDALAGRGNDWSSKGDNVRALADLDTALKIDPNSVIALINRAGVYVLMGRFERAAADADRAGRVMPGLAAAARMGCRARALGKFDLDAALALCNQAVRLQPTTGFYLTDRSLVHLRRGELSEAVSDATAAIGIAPNQAGPYFVRALAEERAGASGAANADRTRALALDPQVGNDFPGLDGRFSGRARQ